MDIEHRILKSLNKGVRVRSAEGVQQWVRAASKKSRVTPEEFSRTLAEMIKDGRVIKRSSKGHILIHVANREQKNLKGKGA